jgi:hypothetical protein
MSTQSLAKALEEVFQQPEIKIPGNFYQLTETVTEMSERIYTGSAACSYYRAAHYRVVPFHKHISRVVDYEQSFSFEEIS